MVRPLAFLLLFIGLPILLFSQQVDSTYQEESDHLSLLEDYVDQLGSDQSFDFNTLLEALEYYQQRPLNINKCTEEELAALNLLSPLQIEQLIQYREQFGELLAIYELQAIPGFDLSSIRRILPYVQVGKDLDDYQVGLLPMLATGRNELFIRWRRNLERARGFDEEYTQPFEGDENQIYTRFRHSYGNRLSYGFTAEKDAGEAFFAKSNPNGFDFYSAHLYLYEYRKWLKSLAIGDYNISFGQGLLLYSGFGARKGSQVMNIKRNQRVLRPYRSVEENNFLRGAAATVRAGKNWEITAFFSSLRRDGNVIQIEDSTAIDDEELGGFSSLQTTGLHRTPNEIEDEDAIRHTVFGGRAQYKQGSFKIALNGLYNRFDQDLQRAIFPYNQFFFNGQELANLSTDYSLRLRNATFFGETAFSDNGGYATTNGLLASLDRQLSISLLHRYFSRDYQAINPNPFAETTGARNEHGLYIGLEYLIGLNWRIHAYADFYEHPWLRFRSDAPSKGADYRLRLTYTIKRKLETYIELRDETKEENQFDENSLSNRLVENRRFQFRFHFARQITKGIRLRSRLDVGFFKRGEEARLNGISLYQDILFTPKSFPLHCTARFALFDTDDFAIRFYNYENGLLYAFSIPAYYNRGRRFYLNLRYRGIRNLTLEARYARTFWTNQDSFGSGADQLNTPYRTTVQAQIKYSF